jgi:DNA helicase IV
MEKHKQQLLENLRAHIEAIQNKISAVMDTTRVMANKSLKEIGSMQPSDQVVYMQLKAYAADRVEQLERLHKSPYFIKCEVLDHSNGEKKEYFFAMHQFSEESVYSWVAPVASIRFEALGEISYLLPDGERKNLTLLRKEQYMIVDGKILFFAKEDPNTPRELVYQEHFTKQKSEFVLPEIVAQMEKAQDTVIRAEHQGPMVISGPAGSGKTTLALHRVAYLTQAPDTASYYPADSILVFVQDAGTKEYFLHLLPGLGIHNVTITTFPEWAMGILGIEDCSYVGRYGNTEEEKDIYEYQKIQALRGSTQVYSPDVFSTLMRAYRPNFTQKSLTLFQNQKAQRKIDRFDLTVLLRSHLEKHGTFEIVKRYDAMVKGVLRKKVQKKQVQYSLIVVDEFQNYLPEQISIIKGCLNERTRSIIYVGDMGQQVYLGTIKEWSDVNEHIPADRAIRLDKVYRNTRNILAYIQKLGYSIGIPSGIKEGPQVVEKVCTTIGEEIEHVKGNLEAYKEGSIGILAKDSSYLDPFKKEFSEYANIHILTMNESQGVEFDLVCIVGIDSRTFVVTEHPSVPTEYIAERKRMQKDLLYVALTRAIIELHVLSREELSSLVQVL